MATRNILRNPVRTPELENLPTGDVRRGLRNALIQADTNYDLASEAEALAEGDAAGAADRRQMIELRNRQAALTPLRVGRVEDVNGLGDAIDYAQGQIGSGMGSMADPLAAGLAVGGAGTALSAIPHPIARAAGGALRGAGAFLAPAAVGGRQMKGEFYGQARENPEIMREYSPQEINTASNLAGAAGGALDAIVPGRVARGVLGAGARAPGAFLRQFGRESLTEGVTELGQGEVGRGLRQVMDPNQDTSGFASDRLNEFAGGAIGGAPFSAAGAAADTAYGQADRAVSAGTAAVQRGAEAVQAKAGDVVDLASGAVKEGAGRARGKVIDLRTQLKERTGAARSGWQQQQEEFDLLNLQPNGIDPGSPEFSQWFTDNRERRNTLTRERLTGMADDAEAQRILAEMDNPETADSAIDQGALYVADNMRFNNVARAADAVGRTAGAAARKAGGFMATMGKAAWEGAKRKQSLQGGEVEGDPDLMGVFMEDAAKREVTRFKGGEKVPAFMGRMGRELGEMVQAGVPADDKALLHIDRMAQHMVGAYGARADDVVSEIARMQPGELTQMLVERIQSALSTTGDTVAVRRSAADQLVALLPAPVEKRLMREGINLRNDEGKRQLLGMVEALSMGRAPAEARRQLAGIVGGDEVVNAMLEAIAPTTPEADGDITTVSEEQMAEQGLKWSDEDGDLVESESAFEKRQGDKALDKRSGAKYYAFGRRPTIDNSKDRRDPFAYTEKLSKSDLQSRLAAGEDGPRRPQLMKQDQVLSSGESAIENKVGAMKRYLKDDSVDVTARSAKEVMDDLGTQPAKRLQLFADYMFQEGKEVGGEQGEKMRQLGRTARKVLRDTVIGARAGKGAVAGTMDDRAQSTAGERKLVKKAMERYFNERYLVVGERMTDTDPERVERADFDNMVKTGKTVMAMREAKDNRAHAHDNNMLFFEDAEGNSMPIKADDLVKHARAGRRANEMGTTAGGQGQWIVDLMAGISSLMESGLATALPTRLDAAGEVESFADGLPANLILPSGRLYGTVVAQRRRNPRTLYSQEDKGEEVAAEQNRDVFVPDDVANASPQRSDQDERDGLRMRTLGQGMAAENIPRKPTPSKRELDAASTAALARAEGSAAPPKPAPKPAAPRTQDLSTPRKVLDALRALHDAAVEGGDETRGRFAALTGKINVRAKGDTATQRGNVPLIKQIDDAYSRFSMRDDGSTAFTEKQDGMAQYLLARLRQSHAYVWDDAPEVAATPGKSRAAPSGEHESRLDEISRAAKALGPAGKILNQARELMLENIEHLSRDNLFLAPAFKPVWAQVNALRASGADTVPIVHRIAMLADQMYGMNPSVELENKARTRLLEGESKLSVFMADVIADPDMPKAVKIIAGAVTKVTGSTPVRLAEPTMKSEGAYSAVRNDIRVKAYGSLGPASTIMHEGVHAATVRAMEQDPELTRAAYALMAHVVNEDPSLQTAYGLTSTLEFMAEGMMNAGLQKRLAKIRPSRVVAKYLGETVANAWDAFVGLVRKALKLAPEQDSALMQLFELTGRAMKARAALPALSTGDQVYAHMNMAVVPGRVIRERIARIDAMKYSIEGRAAIDTYTDNLVMRLMDHGKDEPAFSHGEATELELLTAILAQAPGEISEAEVNLAIITADSAARQHAFPSQVGESGSRKLNAQAVRIHSDLQRPGFAATHDSPIRHEGKFDWRSHQGKGEGAAAFGAGTYLSTADGVHRSYKDQFTAKLTGRDAALNAAFEITSGYGSEQEIVLAVKDLGPDATIEQAREAAIEVMREEADYNDEGGDSVSRAIAHRIRAGKADQHLQTIISAKPDPAAISPTYEVSVDIDPEQLLDWDKPLYEQSDFVKKALDGLESEVPELFMNDLDGSSIYKAVRRQFGSQAKASDALQAAGILGHKYSSAGGKNDAFPNYVIYDDSKITTNYVHFNIQTNQTPFAQRSTKAEQDQARAYIEKVLGPTVKTTFKDITGYSGEWIEATNTIEISTTAGPGAMQIAYHEALHGFFSKFVKADPDALEVLKALADDPRVLRQLERNLAGDRAALAQLRDGEERLAYAYQFWAAGALDLPYGKPRTLFNKIRRFFRRVLGMVSNTERAAAMFDAVHAGKFSDPVAGAQAMQDVMTQGLGTAKAMRKLDGLVQKAAALTMPAESILGNSRSATAQAIGKAFFMNPGDSDARGEPGYLNARDQMGRRYVNEFSHIVSGMDAKDYKSISDYMTSATPTSAITYAPHRKAVKEMRTLLKRFREYMVDESGVKMGNQGEFYYPRVWSLDKLMQSRADFMTMMAKYPDHNAEAVFNALTQNTASDFAYGRPARDDGVLTPFNISSEERVLSFLKPEDAAPFLEDNLVGVMTRYFHQGVRAAEYTKRFGQDGKRLESMLADTHSELVAESRKMMKQGVLKDQAAADKWAERQMRDVRESVGAMEGALGHDISAGWRATNSWMIVYQNIRLLPLSLFASFVDPMGMVARGAEFGEAFEAFKRGITEVGRQWKDIFKEDKSVRPTDHWERLAQYVGTVDAGMFEAQLTDMYSSVYMSPRAKAINETFFKLNGMEAWNRGMRVGATRAAVQFIQRHAKLPVADSQRWLDELGLKADDIVTDAQGNLLVSVGEIAAEKGIDKVAARVIAARVHAGINRWVTGAVLTPNAAQRPAWSSDPHYSMFFHLKQFTYSFHQTILKRAVTEGRHGNIAPLGALFWYVPIMIGSDIMKGMIQGGGELPAHMKGMDAAEWVLYGAERGGIMGLGTLGMDASDDLSSIGGPAVEQVIDAFTDPLDRTMVRGLPVQPIFREALL